MTKYEKLAKELLQPKPATTKKWNPSDYFGYSQNFDHSGNPAPSTPTQAPGSQYLQWLNSIGQSPQKEPSVSTMQQYYASPGASELIQQLGLELSKTGLPIIPDKDLPFVETGKSSGDKERERLLDLLMTTETP